MAKEATETRASKRVSEILAILQKHHIIRGLTPVKLREILEELGPTYVKFGQIMSMRSDMLPLEYTKELEKLRTDVNPMDFSIVKQSIEEELGNRTTEVFASIDPTPLGSASIAQVHKAKLLNGDDVVIKIQRPHIYETMEADIKLLRKACGMLKFSPAGNLLDFKGVVEELWRTSQLEMDFIKEAENIDKFTSFNADVNYILTPKVYHEYTTRKMLVMTNIGGYQIDERIPLTEEGYDMDEIATKAAENYVKQILDDGFFHADPHPGNIHVYDHKIGWIDFGMMGTLTGETQRIITKAVYAIVDDDIYDLEEAFLLLVKPEQEINQTQLIHQLDMIVEKYKEISFSEFDLGPLIEGVIKIIESNKIAVPADLTLLARSMITMEGTLGKVSDHVNLLEILANHMRHKMTKDLDLKTQLVQIAQVLYTNGRKGLRIPSMSADVLKQLKNGHLTINIQSDADMKSLRESRRNNHNLTLAIIVGILYMSASVLTLSDLPKILFGLPFYSIIEFAVGTAILIRLLLDLTKHV